MQVHVEEMTSEVSVIEGELPMTAAQIEKLVKLVMKRISDHQREVVRSREARMLKSQSSAPFEVGT
jgi:hypothetical protein